MSNVIANGYLGLYAQDIGEWQSYATEVLGLALSSLSTPDHLLLRMDNRAWRISIEPGEGGHAFTGWEVANKASLAALAEDFDKAGIAYKEDAKLAEARGVRNLLTVEGPGGTNLEFFYGAVNGGTFVSPTGARFVTSTHAGMPMGLGHVEFSVPDLDEALHFYLDILDFRTSDTYMLSDEAWPTPVYFIHCNLRHHSLALSGCADEPPSLNHFSLEVEDVDMTGRALDRAEERSVPLTCTLGRHLNDHMVSFYIKCPTPGVTVEYGYGGRHTDDAHWVVEHYTEADVWGHKALGD